MSGAKITPYPMPFSDKAITFKTKHRKFDGVKANVSLLDKHEPPARKYGTHGPSDCDTCSYLDDCAPNVRRGGLAICEAPLVSIVGDEGLEIYD